MDSFFSLNRFVNIWNRWCLFASSSSWQFNVYLINSVYPEWITILQRFSDQCRPKTKYLHTQKQNEKKEFSAKNNSPSITRLTWNYTYAFKMMKYDGKFNAMQFGKMRLTDSQLNEGETGKQRSGAIHISIRKYEFFNITANIR